MELVGPNPCLGAGVAPPWCVAYHSRPFLPIGVVGFMSLGLREQQLLLLAMGADRRARFSTAVGTVWHCLPSLCWWRVFACMQLVIP